MGIKTFIQKGRTIKSRGVALCHIDQGYSANGRHISLLTKSDVEPEKLTVEIIKSLEQVNLKLSMEEYLRRFFYIYGSDAELLTKVLGFKTEFEQELEDNPATDEWTIAWNQRHQEWIDEKVAAVDIIKAARDGKELSLPEQYELLKSRLQFEKGCAEIGLDFGEDNSPVVASAQQEVDKSTIAGSQTTITTPSSAGAPATTTKETPVDPTVDITKSQAYLDLMKSNQDLQDKILKQQEGLDAAMEIVKAAQVAKRKVAIDKAAGFAFVAETEREAIADVIENPEQAVILSVLEKASADLKAKEEALVAKDAEIEEIKKSFADGKGVGASGDLKPEVTGNADAQSVLNQKIEARKAELLKAAQA